MKPGFIVPPLLLSMFFFANQACADWFPLEVDVWDPPFNSERLRKSQTYHPVDKAGKPWKICVSIPHLKDAYWTTVNFALVDEAKRLGVRLSVREAGGYDKLAIQRQQIETCMASGADGLIIGSISGDGLNDLVEKFVDQGKPVIDLINGINSDKISARAAITFWDSGYLVADYVRKLSRDKPTRVIWLPGPDGAAWSKAGDQGFREALANSSIEVLETAWGDTGRAAQSGLIEAALDRHSDIDYVIGTAVSAEAAVDILHKRGQSKDTRVLAYYYGPGVHRGIKRGKIVAAPTDKQGIQTRIAMDLVVRAIEGKPYLKHVGAKVEIVDRKNMRAFDETTSIPPRGFRPVFSIGDWDAH